MKTGSGTVVVVVVLVVVVVVGLGVVVDVDEEDVVDAVELVVVVGASVVVGCGPVAPTAQPVNSTTARRALEMSGAAARPANHISEDETTDGSPHQ